MSWTTTENTSFRARLAEWSQHRPEYAGCPDACFICGVSAMYVVRVKGPDAALRTYRLCVRHGTLEHLEAAMKEQERRRR